MTWTKLSDDYDDDCWTLSDAAYRLHTSGHVWSNRKLLDRRIPKADMHRFKTPEAVTELLAEGYWTDEGDAYRIIHHADYQPSKEQVLARQDTNRRNGRRGGRPPKVAVTESVSDSLSRTQSDSVSPEGSESVPETHSLSDSRTQGDGTGQDGQLGEHEVTKADDETSATPDHDGTCVNCGAALPLTAGALLSHRCDQGEYAGGPVPWSTLERVG